MPTQSRSEAALISDLDIADVLLSRVAERIERQPKPSRRWRKIAREIHQMRSLLSPLFP